MGDLLRKLFSSAANLFGKPQSEDDAPFEQTPDEKLLADIYKAKVQRNLRRLNAYSEEIWRDKSGPLFLLPTLQIAEMLGVDPEYRNNHLNAALWVMRNAADESNQRKREEVLYRATNIVLNLIPYMAQVTPALVPQMGLTCLQTGPRTTEMVLKTAEIVLSCDGKATEDAPQDMADFCDTFLRTALTPELADTIGNVAHGPAADIKNLAIDRALKIGETPKAKLSPQDRVALGYGCLVASIDQNIPPNDRPPLNDYHRRGAELILASAEKAKDEKLDMREFIAVDYALNFLINEPPFAAIYSKRAKAIDDVLEPPTKTPNIIIVVSPQPHPKA